MRCFPLGCVLFYIIRRKSMCVLIAINMAVKVFLFVLCTISTVIAGEYRLQELPLLSPHHFHEDFNGGQDSGGEHTEDQGSSSLAHEFIDVGHQDELSDVIEQDYPSHEENYLHLGSHIDIDEGGHQELHGATSYVNMKGHDGEKTEYVVDHSGSSTGGQSGVDSYQLSGHEFKDHAIADDTPALHTSSFAQDHDGHEAVSTFSFKDYNKGTSYSVKQTHGHKGLASVTRKSHDHEDETEHIHGDYGANDHAQSNLQELHEYNHQS